MFYPKMEGVALEAHRTAVSKLQTLAKQELKLGDEGIITRDLRPEDLGLTGYWYFSVTTTSGWNTLVNAATISNTKFVAITGVFYPKTSAQLINQLEVKRSGSTVRYWSIQGANYLDNNIMLFDNPITLGQNQPITIKGYNSETTTLSTEPLAFLGIVVEKKGLTVND